MVTEGCLSLYESRHFVGQMSEGSPLKISLVPGLGSVFKTQGLGTQPGLPVARLPGYKGCITSSDDRVPKQRHREGGPAAATLSCCKLTAIKIRLVAKSEEVPRPRAR